MQLPNFLLVGAAKAGTTAIYHYLSQHPDIYMPTKLKESFFLCNLDKNSFIGPGSHFTDRSISDFSSYKDLYTSAQHANAVGEACVAYLYYYQVTISNIRKYLPDSVSILISLRNPIDRAYSNYMHHVRDGLEISSFKHAIEHEDTRRESGWWWGFRYVDVGLYYNQVKAYIDEFGHHQVKIILFDDLEQNSARVLRELFSFLNVDAAFPVNTSTHYNISGMWHPWLSPIMNPRSMIRRVMRNILPHDLRRSLHRTRTLTRLKNKGLVRSHLNTEDREILIKRFEPDICRLSDLIDRDLSAWLR